LLENTNDNLLINTILKGLLKAQHNEILSYNQVIELMNNLTYFKTDNAIFELSPDSVEAGKYKIQKHSSIVTANNPASIYDVY
jgi:hypothetical protein